MYKLLRNKKTVNLDGFGVFFLLGLCLEFPTQTRRLTSDFTRNYRASRICFLPINRPLSFKKKVCEARAKFWCLLATIFLVSSFNVFNSS
jgi:hypothetical protein